MAKTRIKVIVASRTVPGSEQNLTDNQSVTTFPGYGAAGIYFPAGESEHVVDDKQLEELRALTKPKDAQGRPQAVPLAFTELGPAPDDEGDADKDKPSPGAGGQQPSVASPLPDADKQVPVSRFTSDASSKGKRG